MGQQGQAGFGVGVAAVLGAEAEGIGRAVDLSDPVAIEQEG